MKKNKSNRGNELAPADENDFETLSVLQCVQPDEKIQIIVSDESHDGISYKYGLYHHFNLVHASHKGISHSALVSTFIHKCSVTLAGAPATRLDIKKASQYDLVN